MPNARTVITTPISTASITRTSSTMSGASRPVAITASTTTWPSTRSAIAMLIRSAETHDQYGHDRAELDDPQQPGSDGATLTSSIHGDEAHHRTLVRTRARATGPGVPG